jgi:hypothetical protein
MITRRIFTPIMMLLALAAGLASAGRLDAQTAITAQVSSTGTGWRLVAASDSSSGSDMLWEVNRSGVANLPVSQYQKDIITEAFADEPGSGTGNDIIFFSEEMLAAMEEPSFPSGYEPYIDQQAATTAEDGSGNSTESIFCSWSTETRNRTYNYSRSLFSQNLPFSGAITGQLTLDLPVTGQVTLAATYKIRKCLGVPVGFKFVGATASGSAAITGTGDLQANASASALWEREWLLSEPELGEVSFTVGPVPVRLVFTLPIYAGASFDAKIAGSLTAHLDASATGTFNYNCTPDTCSGSSSFTDQFEFTGPNGSVTVDLGAKAHARVMLRVGLYSSNFAYVEGGVKAYAKAGIWGYYGNACGDADGNGSNETVQALAADRAWGYQFSYGTGGWLLSDQLKYTGGGEFPLGWRDLLGTGQSTALQPMLTGPATAVQGTTQSYTVKMRPCYPYTNAVNFTMSPSGVWSGPTTVTPPNGTATVQRSFANAGSNTITATATSDAFGRNLQTSYSRVINVTSPIPAAPASLTSTALSPTSVRLNWMDNSNNETQFEIQRRLYSSGTFATLTTVGANATTYTDNTVQPLTSYEYRVRSANGSGPSATWSNTSIVTTPQQTPGAPSGLTASYNNTTKTFTLNWADNSTNEQGFTVQFSYSGSAFSDLANVGANVTSYTSGTNPPSGPYQFRVRSYNGTLFSSWSNTASTTVTTVTPTTSIAWIQPAESSWGPAGTLTAAGYAANGTGTVKLVWRERSSTGVWGSWVTVAYQAAPSPDTTWSNTISSGNPTDKCHWFDAYTVYSGVTSATFHYTGAPGCP